MGFYFVTKCCLMINRRRLPAARTVGNVTVVHTFHIMQQCLVIMEAKRRILPGGRQQRSAPDERPCLRTGHGAPVCPSCGLRPRCHRRHPRRRAWSATSVSRPTKASRWSYPWLTVASVTRCTCTARRPAGCFGGPGPDAEVCMTVTLIDGLVVARSTYNTDINYRSVVLIGSATEVRDLDEKRTGLELLVEHIVPGRTATPGHPRKRSSVAPCCWLFPRRRHGQSTYRVAQRRRGRPPPRHLGRGDPHPNAV